MDMHRLFKRGEAWTQRKEAVAVKGVMNIKELVLELVNARNREPCDKVQARAIGMQLINSLRQQEQHRLVEPVGKPWRISL